MGNQVIHSALVLTNVVVVPACGWGQFEAAAACTLVQRANKLSSSNTKSGQSLDTHTHTRMQKHANIKYKHNYQCECANVNVNAKTSVN